MAECEMAECEMAESVAALPAGKPLGTLGLGPLDVVTSWPSSEKLRTGLLVGKRIVVGSVQLLLVDVPGAKDSGPMNVAAKAA